MQIVENTQKWQESLVQEISKQEGAISAHILSAFLQIPRHPFVSSFYERLPSQAGKQVQWQYYEQEESDTATWYEKVYRNQFLVTQLDEHGFPASSSSQPSVMAQMLQMLGVAPGHKVLEIGTGTGYNAAILAQLVGDPRLVTTIDIDAQLVACAEPVIREVIGPGMTILAGDGLDGAKSQAPYDRIIATGSLDSIPLAWQEQLAPGGRLIMNIKRNLANGMLLLHKNEEGSIAGRILPKFFSFMLLHHGNSAYYQVSVPHEPIEPVLHDAADQRFPVTNLAVPDFGFFLQCHLPQARRLSYRMFNYLEDPATERLIQFYEHTVRGDASLWQELLACARLFQKLGLPKREQYTFAIKDGQQIMQLGELQWVIA